MRRVFFTCWKIHLENSSLIGSSSKGLARNVSFMARPELLHKNFSPDRLQRRSSYNWLKDAASTTECSVKNSLKGPVQLYEEMQGHLESDSDPLSRLAGGSLIISVTIIIVMLCPNEGLARKVFQLRPIIQAEKLREARKKFVLISDSCWRTAERRTGMGAGCQQPRSAGASQPCMSDWLDLTGRCESERGDPPVCNVHSGLISLWPPLTDSGLFNLGCYRTSQNCG